MDRTDRIAAFQGADPHATDQLTTLLADADINRSGDLSWDELTLFQQRLLGDHRYRTNHRALHPSDFVRAGGGDCEDFALMTAVLARFWGWEAFVACFFDAHTGHAIALVNSPLPVPYFYQVFDISGRSTLHGDRIPSGRYVPVDYDHVGGYSDAMHAGMRMEYVMNPDRMYGEVM